MTVRRLRRAAKSLVSSIALKKELSSVSTEEAKTSDRNGASNIDIKLVLVHRVSDNSLSVMSGYVQ